MAGSMFVVEGFLPGLGRAMVENPLVAISLTRPGLQPRIAGPGGRRLVHQANGLYRKQANAGARKLCSESPSNLLGSVVDTRSHILALAMLSFQPDAETRDRTGDLQIFGLMLSQLSYRGRCKM